MAAAGRDRPIVRQPAAPADPTPAESATCHRRLFAVADLASTTPGVRRRADGPLPRGALLLFGPNRACRGGGPVPGRDALARERRGGRRRSWPVKRGRSGTASLRSAGRCRTTSRPLTTLVTPPLSSSDDGSWSRRAWSFRLHI